MATSPKRLIQWSEEWQSKLDSLCSRVRAIHVSIDPNLWPYHCPCGDEWDNTTDGDWCGGHWVEMLRIVGELENDSSLTQEAEDRTERLRPYLERDDMFRGHRFYYSAARQYASTGKSKYRTLALAAAYAVRSMAIEANGLMPIGTQVQVRSTTLSGRHIVAVDNVHPNIMLDWWAYKQTGDRVFLNGARAHLDATLHNFVRDDGSTKEFMDFDVKTGKALRHYTLLGADDDSCWSRGQAWAIAGYLRAYEELGDLGYLSTAKRLFQYWTNNADETLVPPWDFKDPMLKISPANVVKDTSAAAIVVEQLARLAVRSADTLDTTARDLVLTYLPKMLSGLFGSLTAAGVLTEGCFNHPKSYATNSELIWGSAYLLMALYYLKSGRLLE
jgi:unsaturated chondroitin disaccharide hydrolase